MKDITKLKLKYFDAISGRFCNLPVNGTCRNQKCSCAVAALVKAYFLAVIPSPYFLYSLSNFNGKDRNGVQVLNNLQLKRARQRICDYCWNGVLEDQVGSMKGHLLSLKSAIQLRRLQGKNVVISASLTMQLSSGKTLIASLIMKLAIKNCLNGKVKYNTYDWISYGVLKLKLTNDPDSVVGHRFCDWLVVDDITKLGMGSRNQSQFVMSIIDPFFQLRIQAGLPTILVFRFDIKGLLKAIELGFGVGISKIVLSKDSHLIYIH